MGLPDSRDLTFVDGVSQVPAATMNALEDWQVNAWSIFRRGGLWFFDDFLGSAFTGQWNNTPTSPTFGDDSAQGASGAWSVSYAVTTSAKLATMTMSLGTSDLWASFRVRVPAVGGAGSGLFIGLANSPFFLGTTDNVLMAVYLPSVNGNNNWWLWYGNGNISGTPNYPTRVDMGIAPGTTTYQRIDVTRKSGVLTAYVEGVQKATASPAPFTLNQAVLITDVERATSGTTTVFEDFAKLWAGIR